MFQLFSRTWWCRICGKCELRSIIGGSKRTRADVVLSLMSGYFCGGFNLNPTTVFNMLISLLCRHRFASTIIKRTLLLVVELFINLEG